MAKAIAAQYEDLDQYIAPTKLDNALDDLEGAQKGCKARLVSEAELAEVLSVGAKKMQKLLPRWVWGHVVLIAEHFVCNSYAYRGEGTTVKAWGGTNGRWKDVQVSRERCTARRYGGYRVTLRIQPSAYEAHFPDAVMSEPLVRHLHESLGATYGGRIEI